MKSEAIQRPSWKEERWKEELVSGSVTWNERLQQVRAAVPDPERLHATRNLLTELETGVLGIREAGAAPSLEQAGWGVVFAADADQAVKEALQPLIDWRREQAARSVAERFRIYEGSRDGYVPGLGAADFRESRGGALGAVDPDLMPYYLLLVGGPQEIPFDFQFQLDIPHAVGRVAFDRPEEYRRYAESVIAYERTGFQLRASPQLSFFSPRLRGDVVTEVMIENLIGELRTSLERRPVAPWRVQTFTGHEATKERLMELFASPDSPKLVFTASHGRNYSPAHPERRDRQGSLVCYRSRPPWPAFGAADVTDQVQLTGTIVVHYGCHTGGVPAVAESEMPISVPGSCSGPFVARLPQRLLAHPDGGALAVLAHIGRSYGYSFVGPANTIQTQGFEDVLRRLMNGGTAGWALEVLNVQFAQLTARYWSERDLEAVSGLSAESSSRLLGLYNAIEDAGHYLILGDPAVRWLTGGER